MPQSILEMAKDLVQAMIQAGTLAPEDMQKELQKTHASLLGLKAQEEAAGGNGALAAPLTNAEDTAPVDWKKSIKKYTVDCLECGTSFKQLSVRHLQQHDLDPRSYRAKYGIPRTHPLSAKETTAMRKKIVQESRPWEKAPTYVKAQNAKDTNSMAAKGRRGRKPAATDA